VTSAGLQDIVSCRANRTVVVCGDSLHRGAGSPCSWFPNGSSHLPRHGSRNVYPLLQLVQCNKGLFAVRDRRFVKQAQVKRYAELATRIEISTSLSCSIWSETYFVAANFRLLMISACNIRAT
jgi:hypothetical protein